MVEKSENSTKTPSKGGRPRKGDFGEERLLSICARVALGETLTSIAKEDGQPSATQFRTAVMKSPMLRDAWEIAKAERPHSLFEQALDLARQLAENDWKPTDTNNVRSMQVAIEALRTAAARLAPRDYGERPSTQVVVPVQINTTLALDEHATPTLKPSVYQIEAALPEP